MKNRNDDENGESIAIGGAGSPESNLVPRFLSILGTPHADAAARAFVDRMQAAVAAEWPPKQRPVETRLHTIAPLAYRELDEPRDRLIQSVIDAAPSQSGKYRIFAQAKGEPTLDRWIDTAAVRFAYAKPRLMDMVGRDPLSLTDVVDRQLGSKRLHHAILNGRHSGELPCDKDICALTPHNLDSLAKQRNAGVATVVELLVLRTLIEDTHRFRTYTDLTYGLLRPSAKQDGQSPS